MAHWWFLDNKKRKKRNCFFVIKYLYRYFFVADDAAPACVHYPYPLTGPINVLFSKTVKKSKWKVQYLLLCCEKECVYVCVCLFTFLFLLFRVFSLPSIPKEMFIAHCITLCTLVEQETNITLKKKDASASFYSCSSLFYSRVSLFNVPEVDSFFYYGMSRQIFLLLSTPTSRACLNVNLCYYFLKVSSLLRKEYSEDRNETNKMLQQSKFSRKGK